MTNEIIIFCALVGVLLIGRGLFSWVTGILSGRYEREILEKDNKNLKEQIRHLEAKVTLFDTIDVVPLDKNKAKLVFGGGTEITFSWEGKLLEVKQNQLSSLPQ